MSPVKNIKSNGLAKLSIDICFVTKWPNGMNVPTSANTPIRI